MNHQGMYPVRYYPIESARIDEQIEEKADTPIVDFAAIYRERARLFGTWGTRSVSNKPRISAELAQKLGFDPAFVSLCEEQETEREATTQAANAGWMAHLRRTNEEVARRK
jgi:hypothetical protein